MTTGDGSDISQEPGRPALRELVEAVAKIEVSSPQTHAHFLAEDAVARRHQHRIDWAWWAVRVTGIIFAAASATGMILLSWHAMDIGEAQQVKFIIGIPTIGLAALFATGKIASITIGQREARFGPTEPDPAPSPAGPVKGKKARKAAS